MALDGFVKIDGIEGESTDDKHVGWIEIIRYGIGIKQTISTAASSVGGVCIGRADFSEFIFRKLIDKASPKLALACAAGTHINEMVVQLCRAGSDKVPFMTYTMNNCLISYVRTTSGLDLPNRFPAETIKVNFGRIQLSYTMQARRGGGPVGNVAGGWDLETNRRV